MDMTKEIIDYEQKLDNKPYYDTMEANTDGATATEDGKTDLEEGQDTTTATATATTIKELSTRLLTDTARDPEKESAEMADSPLTPAADMASSLVPDKDSLSPSRISELLTPPPRPFTSSEVVGLSEPIEPELRVAHIGKKSRSLPVSPQPLAVSHSLAERAHFEFHPSAAAATEPKSKQSPKPIRPTALGQRKLHRGSHIGNEAGNSQQFCLRWNNYQSNLTNVFDELLQNESFVDVTLACEGHSIKAHKMVLSACSPYFQALFYENPCQHPIIIMRDVSWFDLKALVEFMYKGEINVCQDQINPLLKVAETLKIRGLAEVSAGANNPATNAAAAAAPAHSMLPEQRMTIYDEDAEEEEDELTANALLRSNADDLDGDGDGDDDVEGGLLKPKRARLLARLQNDSVAAAAVALDLNQRQRKRSRDGQLLDYNQTGSNNEQSSVPDSPHNNTRPGGGSGSTPSQQSQSQSQPLAMTTSTIVRNPFASPNPQSLVITNVSGSLSSASSSSGNSTAGGSSSSAAASASAATSSSSAGSTYRSPPPSTAQNSASMAALQSPTAATSASHANMAAAVAAAHHGQHQPPPPPPSAAMHHQAAAAAAAQQLAAAHHQQQLHAAAHSHAAMASALGASLVAAATGSTSDSSPSTGGPPVPHHDDMEIKPEIAEMIREEERAKMIESSGGHGWMGATTGTSVAADSYQYQLQSMWQKCWNTNQQNLVQQLRFRERGPLKSWRPEAMAEAIFSVLKEGLSLSQAARKYDIPYPTFVLYANRVHNMLGPSLDGGTDPRPKARGRPQRILLGMWPEELIRSVIKAVVFRDYREIKEDIGAAAHQYANGQAHGPHFGAGAGNSAASAAANGYHSAAKMVAQNAALAPPDTNSTLSSMTETLRRQILSQQQQQQSPIAQSLNMYKSPAYLQRSEIEDQVTAAAAVAAAKHQQNERRGSENLPDLSALGLMNLPGLNVMPTQQASHMRGSGSSGSAGAPLHPSAASYSRDLSRERELKDAMQARQYGNQSRGSSSSAGSKSASMHERIHGASMNRPGAASPYSHYPKHKELSNYAYNKRFLESLPAGFDFEAIANGLLQKSVSKSPRFEDFFPGQDMSELFASADAATTVRESPLMKIKLEQQQAADVPHED
ncbi:protein bric-a-brac 2 [Scaptodrosophila lebanonensis]|uniref:Protein bric-a-brac 2 n=1 Tax=Drosophila lebanonensis TaxID=7225 RepID=A0A6J2UBI7_DROLE|nr:protein bric-a-brac 2 [Scaptodrosophila lebanonensis]